MAPATTRRTASVMSVLRFMLQPRFRLRSTRRPSGRLVRAVRLDPGRALGEVEERGTELDGPLDRDVDLEGRHRLVRLVDDPGLVLGREPPERSDRAVVERDPEPGESDVLAGGKRLERLLHRSGVRPDQAALAELRPALVPGHDDRDVADTAVEQDREHRPPGRAVELAVIAHPDLARGAGRPDDVRPAVVRRVRELGPDISDEGPRRLDRR